MPSVPTPIYRKQIPVTYPGSGNTQIVKLNKTLLYRELALELACTPTLTAANNTVANTKRGDSWGVIKQIQWIANGSDVLRTMTGDDLWWLNYFWYGVAPQQDLNLGDGATANPAIDNTLILPAWKPRAFHPMDTAINSARFNDVQLAITFGTYTDINGSASAWTSNPQVNVLSHEQVAPQTPADNPMANWVMQKLTNSPSGSNTSYRVPLDAGVSYASFIINAQDNSSPAVDSTTLITNVKVVGAGGRVYVDMPWSQVTDYARTKFSLNRGSYKSFNASASTITDSTGGVAAATFAAITAPAANATTSLSADMLAVKNALAQIALNLNAVQAGLNGRMLQPGLRVNTVNKDNAWGYINLCDDGFLGEALPNPNDAYLEFNVGSAGTINVLAAKIFPIG